MASSTSTGHLRSLFVVAAILGVAKSVSLPPNTELCIDHAGSDLQLFSPNSSNMTLCYESCLQNAFCVGWVYMPPNCTFGSVPHGKPLCWLKSQWNGGAKRSDCCRDSGLVRKPPPSTGRPTIYPPFESCSSESPVVTVAVDPTNVTHAENPLYKGCHLDLGFSHQPQAFYSQMVYSAGFELGDPSKMWDPKSTPNGVGWVPYMEAPGVQGKMSLDAGNRLTNHSTLLLTKVDSGTGAYGVANRGLGHEGLVFESGKPYEGYVVVQSSASATITVQLVDRSSDPVKVLSVQDMEISGGGKWTKLPFTLTPNASTVCDGILEGSDPTVGCPVYNNTYGANARMSDLTAHICVKCGGQFVVGVRSGSANLGFSFLQPGEWGRLGNLSVLASGAKLLQDMGITAVRQGGSFAASADYFWKRWVPLDPSGMPSVVWNEDVETGWGPFHLIDMCNALGIEPIVTTFAVPAEPEDMADFVEYTHGNASTRWGRMRVDAGHPEPYRWRFVELGNEQYNSEFVDQVQAMEQRATSLGMAGHFYYLFPSNGGVNETDQARAKALGVGDRLAVDIHDGAGGAVARALDLLRKYPTWGSVNAETNCNDHTAHRMLQEAQDLLAFLDAGLPQLHFRAGSFCVERSGYNEGGLNDQGISFYLPNMTWLQPPGYVHSMLARFWQPQALAAQVSGCGAACGIGPCVTAHAQASAGGANVSVYLLNMTPDKVTINLSVAAHWKPSSTVVSAQQMHSESLQTANTPGNPTVVSPVPVTVDITKPIQVPEQSFTAFSIAGTKA